MITNKWIHLTYSVRERNNVTKSKAILRIEKEVRWEFQRILDRVVKEVFCGVPTVNRDQNEMCRQAMRIAGMRGFQREESVCAKALG